MGKHIFLAVDEQSGIVPQVQDRKYWHDSGYVFTAFETEDAITLAKRDIKTLNHAAFSPNVIPPTK